MIACPLFPAHLCSVPPFLMSAAAPSGGFLPSLHGPDGSSSASLLMPSAPSPALCTVRMLDGSHYIGEINTAEQPHGQGATIYSDGSHAMTLADPADAGRWIDGKLHGRGTQILASGDRYEGLFKDSLRDGLGVLSLKDGSRFEGHFAANQFSGLGARWDKFGKLNACGRWADNNPTRGCAVFLRCIPHGTYLSAAGQCTAHCAPASLLIASRSSTDSLSSMLCRLQPGKLCSLIPTAR